MPRLKSLGYSHDVLEQLSCSRRTSSNRTYESKWRLFAQFCSDRGCDAFAASPALVADFLLSVARTRHASVSTLAGYRTAVGHVLRLVTGYDPGTCPILSQLMQSFKPTQLVPVSRVPKWDVTLVLDVLCRATSDDVSLSDDLLTAKTVFLFALASGVRRHALAALRFPPLFKQGSVTVTYDHAFVPTSYFVRHNLTKLAPLSLPACPLPNLQRACPVRTLRAYCIRTTRRRSAQQTFLFIPVDQSVRTSIYVHSMARFLIKIVHWCYASASREHPDCHAHDVRKISASLRALPSVFIQDVLGRVTGPVRILSSNITMYSFRTTKCHA